MSGQCVRLCAGEHRPHRFCLNRIQPPRVLRGTRNCISGGPRGLALSMHPDWELMEGYGFVELHSPYCSITQRVAGAGANRDKKNEEVP